MSDKPRIVVTRRIPQPALDLLAEYGIGTMPHRIVTSRDEAIAVLEARSGWSGPEDAFGYYSSLTSQFAQTPDTPKLVALHEFAGEDFVSIILGNQFFACRIESFDVCFCPPV